MSDTEMFKPTIKLTEDPTKRHRLCDCDGPVTLHSVDGTLNTWRCEKCERTIRIDLRGFEVKPQCVCGSTDVTVSARGTVLHNGCEWKP